MSEAEGVHKQGETMSLRLMTGFEVPDDFPQKPYEAILTRVGSQRHPDSLFHYSGSWNAVAYRFTSCATSSETFTDSVRVAGFAPPLPERFEQEVALFNFFINGLAVIDSFFYGLYWIGSMVDTKSFPIRSGDDLRHIQVHCTVKIYTANFPSSPLIAAFGCLGHVASSSNWKITPKRPYLFEVETSYFRLRAS